MYVSHNVCLESEGAASMLRILLFRGGNPFLHTGRSSCNFVTMVDGTEEGEGGERRSARMRAMRVRCVNRTNPPHVRWCIGAGARTRWGRESNKEQTVKPKRAKCKNRSERLCSMNFGLIFFFLVAERKKVYSKIENRLHATLHSSPCYNRERKNAGPDFVRGFGLPARRVLPAVDQDPAGGDHQDGQARGGAHRGGRER